MSVIKDCLGFIKNMIALFIKLMLTRAILCRIICNHVLVLHHHSADTVTCIYVSTYTYLFIFDDNC